jgi:hypothetical protein
MASGTLPPGHPPGAPTGAPAHPPAPGGELPAGHPPVGPGPAGSAGPQDPAPTPDSTLPANDLPAGTIEAKIVDQNDRPIAGADVRLGVLKQTVAEGERRSHRSGKTNPDGMIRFDGLEIGSDFSYRVSVKSDPAEYASDPFNLGREVGQRVLLHVYPVTHDVSRTLVGMRGILVVEPRDDVFQFQAMFRVFNMGRITWVPTDISIDLPEGAKGFNVPESMTDTRFVNEGDQARLLGTFAPGEHDVSFSFQVPNDHDENVEFRLSLPPHVAEVRVIAEAARGMGLSVQGFDPAESANAPGGQRVLVTSRRLRQGEPEMSAVTIRLSGVPTPGPGRWIAAVLAALGVLAGLAVALSSSKEASSRSSEQDVEQARELLLEELVALEKAHRAGEIGPASYERLRRELLDSVARLDGEKTARSARQKPTAWAAAAER